MSVFEATECLQVTFFEGSVIDDVWKIDNVMVNVLGVLALTFVKNLLKYVSSFDISFANTPDYAGKTCAFAKQQKKSLN